MAGHGFSRTNGQFLRMYSEYLLDGITLDDIASQRGRAMGIDIIDLSRAHPGISQGILHTPDCSIARFRWRCHMVSITTNAIPHQFGINFSSPVNSMLILFQNHNPGTVSENKAVPIPVPGTAGALWVIVTC